MMKKLTLFLTALTLLTAPTLAADLPRIAVYVTGDLPANEKKAFGTTMLATLVNSGRYRGIERSEAFLAEIDREHEKQRSGAIDDKQISALGLQFGVGFVCIADITPAFGSYQVSARVVDVETAEVVFIGQAFSNLQSAQELTQVSEDVVHIMFREHTAAKPQPAPRPNLDMAHKPRPAETRVEAMPKAPSSYGKKTAGIGLATIGVGLLAYGLVENVVYQGINSMITNKSISKLTLF